MQLVVFAIQGLYLRALCLNGVSSPSRCWSSESTATTFGMFHTRRWNHDLVNLQELSSIVRQISQFFLILMYINDIVSLADVADRLVASPYRVYGSRLRISTWHPLMRKDKNCAWIVRRILAECMTASKSSKAIRISMEFIPCFPMNMIFQADSSW